ncbi:MAG: EFR1 family ferrodoxin [Bacteroidales bacterium]|nr:EFR1 family ferrodoxin [Bacteroidales bacterium]
MNCLLIYYTGTYNTRFLTAKLKARLEREGWSVDSYEIDPLNNERLDLSHYDIIGLGYPIYGYCAPYAFLKFVRAQKLPRGMRVFIYKDSGETEHANDASSKYLLRKLRRDGACTDNEYHFLMPYNIHFRFDDRLVKEMLTMDDRLLDILVYELTNNIGNMKRFRLWPRLVSAVVSRPQYIGGDVNSFLYKVDMDKCIGCDLCIRRCPMQNIYRDSSGVIRFHHHCLMCMRCSFFCPADAIHIGFLEDWGWKVNGGYDLHAIEKMPTTEPVITDSTTGFFKCYIETYSKINSRHREIFGE